MLAIVSEMVVCCLLIENMFLDVTSSEIIPLSILTVHGHVKYEDIITTVITDMEYSLAVPVSGT